ncbi:polyubiquitin [Scyliorhinus canicula]|uniref:polyubiquitin n=1 Tax=Scyliorhinus canicula TaxID=7830 RepID=UPI0018F67B43|nr:polyubiquitin [Scyliorhinus canicula]
MGKIYQVFVVGLKGEKLTVDISESEAEFNAMTVAGFKEKLLQKLPGQAAAADDLRILFASTQLEVGKKFSDYQIKDKSTILLVLRLPGGMEQ